MIEQEINVYSENKKVFPSFLESWNIMPPSMVIYTT